MTKPSSHKAARGDTLIGIARFYDKTVQELVDINQIKNPNILYIGQVIYLEPPQPPKDTLQVMFMDKLRHPIEGIAAKLKLDGKEHECKSNACGLLPELELERLGSAVEVWVQNARKEWKKVGETVASKGQQWMGVVSPSIKLTHALAPHDVEAAKKKYEPAHNPDKPHDGKAKGAPVKEGSAAHKSQNSAHNTIELSVDIPQDLIEYFKGYKDEPIAEEDWKKAAFQLACDINVLKAIAEKETGRQAYWRLRPENGPHVPSIMFERHYFHRLTKGVYDKTNPDISWPVPYLPNKLKDGSSLLGMNNAEVHAVLKDKNQRQYTHDDKVDVEDIRSTFSRAYLRLLNAYRLDKDAALKSCSWGKFQIMGANSAYCDVKSLKEFVQAMCTSERGQLSMFAGFIQNYPAASIKDSHGRTIGYRKSLHQAVKDKDWGTIGYYYNGPDYAKEAYHTKLEAIYNRLMKVAV